MTAPALFDAAPFEVPAAPPAPPLSADRRRTILQAKRLAAGVHPLAGVDPRIRLHADAAPAADRAAEGLRCGDCRFREVLAYRRRSYAKCTARDGDRMTHGAASDVRAWWPACRDYEAGDPISPDAARWTGEEAR